MTDDDAHESLTALRDIATALGADPGTVTRAALEITEARPDISTAQATLLALAGVAREPRTRPAPPWQEPVAAW
jgi:hypothetical protein